MRLLAGIGALLLAACATTPASIRQEAPKLVLPTARPEPALEECIAERFAFLGGPAIIRGPTRVSLQFGDGGIVSLLIDLDPGVVTVRSSYPFGGKERDQLQSCV
jgi:hypothetical protein